MRAAVRSLAACAPVSAVPVVAASGPAGRRKIVGATGTTETVGATGSDVSNSSKACATTEGCGSAVAARELSWVTFDDAAMKPTATSEKPMAAAVQRTGLLTGRVDMQRDHA